LRWGLTLIGALPLAEWVGPERNPRSDDIKAKELSRTEYETPIDTMAKFLDGSGVQSALIDIIKHSEKKLLIVSPYLKVSTQTKNYLTSIDKKKVPIIIIFRTDFRINNDDLSFFKELKYLKLYHCANLHSKCYLNEKEGLITSMNLHEHSQTHNWEMGIKFSRESDADIYREVISELKHMVSLAIHFQTPTDTRIEEKNTRDIVILPHGEPGKEAYCIRCRESLGKFNVKKPFCDKCYSSWVRFRNENYKEKFCHLCGSSITNGQISCGHPLCNNCVSSYKFHNK
jgi:hypothetical protein